jgi:hypothetical protein
MLKAEKRLESDEFERITLKTDRHIQKLHIFANSKDEFSK